MHHSESPEPLHVLVRNTLSAMPKLRILNHCHYSGEKDQELDAIAIIVVNSLVDVVETLHSKLGLDRIAETQFNSALARKRGISGKCCNQVTYIRDVNLRKLRHLGRYQKRGSGEYEQVIVAVTCDDFERGYYSGNIIPPPRRLLQPRLEI
jgi:hypothetical protein